MELVVPVRRADFAGPVRVVGGRRRRARRDALAALLAVERSLIIAAGAPDAPVHEDGALPELRGPALARRLGGPAAPQALGAGPLGGLRRVAAQLPPARVPGHPRPCDGAPSLLRRGAPLGWAGGGLPPIVSQIKYFNHKYTHDIQCIDTFSVPLRRNTGGLPGEIREHRSGGSLGGGASLRGQPRGRSPAGPVNVGRHPAA